MGKNMSFSEEFLNITAREIESRSVIPDFEHARKFIMQALKVCAQQEKSIKLDNIDIYFHGSYANKSNIYFPSNLEIMVEITTAKRFSPEEVSLENNYFVDVPIEFGPKEFRLLLTQVLREMMGDRLVEQPKFLRLTDLENIKHNIDITPCISFYHYEKGAKKKDADILRHKGVLVYDTSIDRNIVTFPRIHAQKGFDKDQETRGNFKRFVRVFKTLHSLNINEFSFASPSIASGYFIECLLYNVPNYLFYDARTNVNVAKGSAPKPESMNEIFNKIMNYLVNADMNDFICQNGIWNLFGTAAEFWSTKRAEAFLGSIIRLYSVFPSSRAFLA